MVADIGAQVAAGLAAAHQAGTMHRDVKPGNVLIREDGVAKISDFGIARSHGDPALTQSGFLTGTPSYFSPELARGAEPGSGTDVWALGATLYAAVEGRSPYEQKTNPVAVLHDITSGQPARPRRAEFLEPALLRMMDRNPDSRWSMDDAAHGLRRLADSNTAGGTREQTAGVAAPSTQVERPSPEPAPAAAPVDPPGPSYDEGRGRRSRGPVYAVLAAVALLLVIGGVALAASLRSDPGDSAGGVGRGEQPGLVAVRVEESPEVEEPLAERAGDADPRAQHPVRVADADPLDEAGVRNRAGGAEVVPHRLLRPGAGRHGRGLGHAHPGYQATVGRGSYDGFWRTIESVSVGDVTPAGDGAVRASLTYTKTDGSTTTEQHLIPLQQSGDGYLIDGDGPA